MYARDIAYFVPVIGSYFPILPPVPGRQAGMEKISSGKGLRFVFSDLPRQTGAVI